MSEPMTPTRKALSARLRFNVFKRDQFACQYCGAHPPAVVLECDHIIPVAEGGQNDIYNLVTACQDCNRGKAAVSLCVVPQSLADRAAEVAEREAQLRGYAEVMEAQRERLEDDVWRVLSILSPGAHSVPRTEYASVRRFVERLGVYKVMEAAQIARGSRTYGSRMFRYFCGVCWNMVREMEGKE